MTDSNPSSTAPASGCCTPSVGGCCPSPCCCPCAPRIAKLEKTVCRIRTGLLIALGVLILLIGVAIGKGGQHGPGGPGAGPGPGGPMRGPMHGPGPGPGRPGRDGPGEDRRDD